MGTRSTALEEFLRTFEGQVRDAPGLKDLKGRLLLEAAGKPEAMLTIDDGHLQVARETGPADAAIEFENADTLVEVMDGRLNPVVANLQGRLTASGNDLVLATKTLIRLQAGDPFGSAPAKEGAHHGR